MLTYSENILLPIEKVWEHFLHKIEHPENFVPGVSNVSISERTAEFVLREMDLQTPVADKVRVSEKIFFEPYTVKFLIIDHPVYEGFVDNLAEKISDMETKITFSMSWKNKKTGDYFLDQNLIESAVKKTIRYMEEAGSKS